MVSGLLTPHSPPSRIILKQLYLYMKTKWYTTYVHSRLLKIRRGFILKWIEKNNGRKTRFWTYETCRSFVILPINWKGWNHMCLIHRFSRVEKLSTLYNNQMVKSSVIMGNCKIREEVNYRMIEGKVDAGNACARMKERYIGPICCTNP